MWWGAVSDNSSHTSLDLPLLGKQLDQWQGWRQTFCRHHQDLFCGHRPPIHAWGHQDDPPLLSLKNHLKLHHLLTNHDSTFGLKQNEQKVAINIFFELCGFSNNYGSALNEKIQIYLFCLPWQKQKSKFYGIAADVRNFPDTEK